MKIKAFGIALMALLFSCSPKEFHDQKDFSNTANESLPGTDSKITNGLRAMPGSFISNHTVAVVSNFNDKNGSYFGFCSGVLLSPTVIITAAHCVSKIENMRVVLGTSIPQAILSKENIYQIKRAIVHSQFSLESHALDRRFYDLALVQLKRAVLSSDNQQSLISQVEQLQTTSQFLHLIDEGDKTSSNLLIPSIAGFGVSFQKSNDTTNPIKTFGSLSEAPINLSKFDYSQRIIKLSADHSSQACVGDSGGALYIWRENQFYLQAIAISIKADSSSDPFARTICEKESSFLNIDYFKSWIIETSRGFDSGL